MCILYAAASLKRHTIKTPVKLKGYRSYNALGRYEFEFIRWRYCLRFAAIPRLFSSHGIMYYPLQLLHTRSTSCPVFLFAIQSRTWSHFVSNN
ncbi:hypothetical protein M378DRAFT_791629 [Amanita muscaria Koide BX008]|uniref:Uncharacterized protein n=1 Tax=Amanita muscaria (strain Koide BX008) TaxID=946122 RepID=A0A0C2WZS1_AMAMK|nr:hypothetical protein M378DRAFT_791629 [Amanita muscaria Koide BX008]